MRHLTGLAVTGLTLVLALPAAAQDRPVEGGEYQIGATAPDSQQKRYRHQAPAPPPTSRIVGGLRLSDKAELGFGLFSVVGSTEKEIVRRRTNPSGDYRMKESKSAGLGLSLRF